MMTATVSSPSTRSTRRPKVRDVRRFRRIVAAVILLVPATTVAIGRLFVTDDSDTTRALDLVAADPGRQFTLTLFSFFAIVTFVPAFLAAGRLAKRRRPVLAMIALGANLIAYVSAWSFPAVNNMYFAGAKLPIEQRDGAAALIDAMWAHGFLSISAILMVIGHVSGAILMGLALRGSIPTVGWVAMILSQPAHLAFLVLPSQLIDALAWGLIALAFAFCAVAVLRTPDDEWDLPPLSATSELAPSHQAEQGEPE
jgi:hypothetical protein